MAYNLIYNAKDMAFKPYANFMAQYYYDLMSDLRARCFADTWYHSHFQNMPDNYNFMDVSYSYAGLSLAYGKDAALMDIESPIVAQFISDYPPYSHDLFRDTANLYHDMWDYGLYYNYFGTLQQLTEDLFKKVFNNTYTPFSYAKSPKMLANLINFVRNIHTFKFNIIKCKYYKRYYHIGTGAYDETIQTDRLQAGYSMPWGSSGKRDGGYPIYLFGTTKDVELKLTVTSEEWHKLSYFHTSLVEGENTVYTSIEVKKSDPDYQLLYDELMTGWPYYDEDMEGAYFASDLKIYRTPILCTGWTSAIPDHSRHIYYYPKTKFEPYFADITELIEARGGIVNKPEQPIVW